MKRKYLSRANASWLLIFIAVVLIAIVVLLGYLIYSAAQEATFEEFNNKQFVLIDEVAEGIKLYFNGIAHELHDDSSLDGVQDFDETISREELKRSFLQFKNRGVNDFGLLNKEGVLLYSVAAPQLEGTDFSFRSYYKEAKKIKNRQDFVIEFIDFKGADAGKKGVLIAVPVFKEGDFVGVVVATARLDFIVQRFVKRIKSSKNSHAYYIDSNSNILFSPDKRDFGKKLLQRARGFEDFQMTIKKMLEGKKGRGRYSYYQFDENKMEFIRGKRNDQDYLIAYEPIRIGKTLLIISEWAPLNDASDLIRFVFIRLFVLVGVVILLIVFSSTYAIYSLRRSSLILEEEVDNRTIELKASESRFRRIAETLQDSLLRPVPKIKGLDIWAANESAYEPEKVGGDFFDIFEISENLIGILVGDVSGKGIEAAGLTETTRSAIRAVASIDPSPSKVFFQVNKSFIKQLHLHDFVTASFIVFDKRSREVKIASAGHPPPVIVGERIDYLAVDQGHPLGTFSGEYNDVVFKLERGQSIILYTDGLIEARRGPVYYVEAEFFKTLSSVKSRKSKDIVEGLLASAKDFSKGKLVDDIIIVAIRFD